MKFSEFNQEVNPNNENCYMVETSTGKQDGLNFQEAKVLMGSDPSATLYWKITKGFFIIRTTVNELIEIAVNKNEPVMVVQNGKKIDIYCKGPFDKNTTNNLLACGVNADTLAYTKNGTSVQLPFYNPRICKSQKALGCNILHDFGIKYTPKWLTPLRRANSTTADGIQVPISNNAEKIIINHISNLKNFNKFDIKDIIDIINDNLCVNPMTPQEIKAITDALEETLLAQFVDKGQFFHNKLGDYVIDACHIKRDENGKKLFFWNQKKSIYTDDEDFLMGYMTRLCPQLKQYQKDETQKYILNYLFEDAVNFNTNEYTVVFKNGVLDVLNWNFEPMTPDHYESIQINTEFNPNATGDTADEFFSTATCGDKDVEQLLYEAIGYSMLKTNELAKAFMLVGSGRNGKSTYLDIMKRLLGTKNYSAVSFKDLSNNFRAANLIDKLASLAGDISAQPIQESDLFKSIAAAEDIMLEQKYKQAFVGKLFSTMFFSCNKLPKTPDTSDGFYRRFVIVPFNANLSKVSTVDGIEFKQKLLSDESIQYIAYKALKAIYTVLKTTKEFTEPDCVKEIKRQYRIDNSSVLSWFQEKYGSDINKLKGLTLTRAYGSYTTWCNEANRPPASKTSFTQNIATEFGVELE